MSAAFRRALPSGLAVASTAAEHVEQLEGLQKAVFPTLDPAELFLAEHYRKHIELFPEGQFVALDADRVVGMTSTLRLPFDFLGADHTFAEVIEGGWLTSHDPEGEWMYGVDVGTHPDYRGRGVARALYAARQESAQRLGLAGQVTVGMLSGYGALKDQLSAREYYDQLVAGERDDPTVSAQRRVGFNLRGLVSGYVNDPVCDGYGALLVLPSETDVAWPT